MKKIVTIRKAFFLVLLTVNLFYTHAQGIDTTIFKTVQLDTVQIVKYKQVVRQSGTAIHIKIHNTLFENMGNVAQMLESIPGMVRTAKGLEVRGRGLPIYVLDGRELKQEDILQTISTEGIDNIIIERAPSSEYSSKALAVVYINTRKHLKDHIFLGMTNILSKKRKWSETPMTTFKYQKGAFSTILSCLYSNGGNLNKETYYRDIYHADNTFFSVVDRENPTRDYSEKVNWSSEFLINKKNRIGLYYYFYHLDGTDKETGSTLITEDNTNTRKEENILTKHRNAVHSISLSYLLNTNTGQLSFIQDVAMTTKRNNVDSHEYNVQTDRSSRICSNNRQNYVFSTTNLNHSFTLPSGIMSQFGVRYELIHYSSETQVGNDESIENIYQTIAKVNEHNVSAWTEFKKEWDKFNVKLGLRYEYTHRQTNDRENKAKNTTLYKQTYSNFFPKISAEYTPNDNVTISAYYSRNIVHPNYNKISPMLIYKDSLSYETGNADVKSTIFDRLSVDVDWKDFTLSFGYCHAKNPIIEPYMCMDDKSNITVSHPENLSKYVEFNPSISYNKTVKRLNISLYADLTIPYAEYPYLGQTVKTNTVQVGGQLNCSYKFNDKYILYTTFQYQGKNDYLITVQKAVNKWDIGLTAKLLKNRLTADVVLMDILHGAHYNNLYDRYLNVKDGTSGTNDFRGIRLTLRYNIFKKEISNALERGNENVLQRAGL